MKLNTRILILALNSLLTLVCGAQTTDTTRTIPVLTLTTGQTYTNATIKPLSPIDGAVFFDGGGAKISLKDLPEPYRTEYYDPEKAEEFFEEQSKKKAQQEVFQQEQQKKTLEIWKENNLRIVNSREVNISSMGYLAGRISQVHPDKKMITLRLYHTVLVKGTPLTSLQEAGAFGGTPPSETPELGNKVVFIKIDPVGLADGEDIIIKAVKVGTLTEKNVRGEATTLELYDCGQPYKSTLKSIPALSANDLQSRIVKKGPPPLWIIRKQ